jgi:hypothetical protein
MRTAQIPTSILAWKSAADLELEINERIEVAPRKKCQHDKCGSRKSGSNRIRRCCKWIFLLAGLQQQVCEEQRYGEKAKHKKRGGVLTPPSEIGQPRQQLHRGSERGSPEEC